MSAINTFKGKLVLAAVAFVATTGVPALAQNPVVGGWGSIRTGYDPFHDRWHIERDRTRVRESAFDWDRNRVDPGSYRYVDRWYRDRFGRLVHEYGPTWTSFGKPHGRLTREVVRHRPARPWGPGVVERDRDTVVYSKQLSGGNGPRHGRSGVVERDRDTVIFARPDPKRR